MINTLHQLAYGHDNVTTLSLYRRRDNPDQTWRGAVRCSICAARAPRGAGRVDALLRTAPWLATCTRTPVGRRVAQLTKTGRVGGWASGHQPTHTQEIVRTRTIPSEGFRLGWGVAGAYKARTKQNLYSSIESDTALE